MIKTRASGRDVSLLIQRISPSDAVKSEPEFPIIETPTVMSGVMMIISCRCLVADDITGCGIAQTRIICDDLDQERGKCYLLLLRMSCS